MKTFSNVVKLILTQKNIKVDKSVIFCDDNIENVVNMQQFRDYWLLG